MLDGQPVEGARRDHHARHDVVGVQIEQVARLRRPLKGHRARRRRQEAVDATVVERRARLVERQRHQRQAERGHHFGLGRVVVERPQLDPAQLVDGADRVAREHHARPDLAVAEVDQAGAQELRFEHAAQPRRDVLGLGAALEQPGQPRDAEGGRPALALPRARADAVELVALDALTGLDVVAGDAAQVPLEPHLVVGRLRDVTRERLHFARPRRPLGHDRAHAQRVLRVRRRAARQRRHQPEEQPSKPSHRVSVSRGPAAAQPVAALV